MAKPFHVVSIAVAPWFVYTNGVLCYNTDGGYLRLLDIKNSADHELVVNVFKMLRENHYPLPRFAGHKLMPIHYGHGVLTCELRLQESPSMAYLIVMRPRSGELLFVEQQPLQQKTIVATCEKYMFLCHPVRETRPAWGLRKFNLETLEWVHDVPRFVSAARRTENSVACTVYGDHVYIVSSRDPLIHISRAPPGVGQGPVLDYQAIRIPLEARPDHPLEVEVTRASWLHPYTGHMGMEAWDFLRLETDEKTGNLGAIQVRMEYPVNGPNTMRKCIKRTLAFAGHSTALPRLANVLQNLANSLPLDGHLGTAHMVNALYSRLIYSVNSGSPGGYNGFGFPPPGLPPKTTCHFGDTRSPIPAYSGSQCFIRSYFSTSNSFVDLVNDTLRNNGKEQSLRLRVMTEIPGGGNKTVFWPPKDDPLNPDARLQELNRIMNPPGYDGNIRWNVDGSSFVYATALHENSLNRSIVYVGFDPTVKFHHLQSFNKADPKGHVANGQPGLNEGPGPGSSIQTNVDTSSRNKKQKPSFPSLGVSWAWLEEPLYFKSQGKNGFDFFA